MRRLGSWWQAWQRHRRAQRLTALFLAGRYTINQLRAMEGLPPLREYGGPVSP